MTKELKVNFRGVDSTADVFYSRRLDNIMKSILDKREYFPLFHYTSAAALCSILNNNELWFTKWNCLNDPSEFRHIHNVIQSQLERYKTTDTDFYRTVKDFNNFDIETKRAEHKWSIDYQIYILSFTKREDELDMWSCYSKGHQNDGYAISFNTTPYRKVTCSINDKGDKISSNIVLVPTIYNLTQQKSVTNRALELLRKAFNDNKKINNKDDRARLLIKLLDKFVLEMGCRFKNEKYKDEQEVRAILCLNEEERKYVRHRTANGIIVPYVPLKLCPHTIAEITISPTLQGTVALSGLRSMKERLGLSFDIKQSDIPYRNI